MSVYGWLQVFTSDYDVLTNGYRWLRVVGVVLFGYGVVTGGYGWFIGGYKWI